MPICNTVRWPIRVSNVHYDTRNGAPMMQVKGRELLDEEEREEQGPKEVRRWGYDFHDIIYP